MKITGGKGARIVFDPVGGPYVDTLAQAMAVDGTLFIYGGLSGQPTMHPHWPAAFKNLSIRGWVASTIWNLSGALRAREGADPAGTGGGPPEARDREDLQARRHRGSPPIPGIECPDRKAGGDAVRNGGAEGDRTLDLRIANATLSQLSYRPTPCKPGPRPGRRGILAGTLASASDSLLISGPCWKPSRRRRNSRCPTRTVTTFR